MTHIDAALRPERTQLQDTKAPSEAEIIAAWEARIRAIVRRELRGRPLGLLGPDLEQEARLALLLAIRAGHVADHYLYTVISNQLRDVLRRPASQALAPLSEAPLMTWEFAPTDSIGVRWVRRWLSAEPAPLREIFHLLYDRGLNQRQAAKKLGVSQPRVAALHRKLLGRARARASPSLAAW